MPTHARTRARTYTKTRRKETFKEQRLTNVPAAIPTEWREKIEQKCENAKKNTSIEYACDSLGSAWKECMCIVHTHLIPVLYFSISIPIWIIQLYGLRMWTNMTLLPLLVVVVVVICWNATHNADFSNIDQLLCSINQCKRMNFA